MLMVLVFLCAGMLPLNALAQREGRKATRSTSRVERKARTERPTMTSRQATPRADRTRGRREQTRGDDHRGDRVRRDRNHDGRGVERWDRNHDGRGVERRDRNHDGHVVDRRPNRRQPDSKRHQVTHVHRKHPVYVPVRDRIPYRRHRHVYLTPRHPFRVNVVRPFVHVDLYWPWTHRYHRKWAPRYRYRQVVYVNVGWGHRHRQSRVEVETTYRHRIRHATDTYAEVDITLEEVAFYEDGRYLGSVHHIPDRLARLRATVYRNGEVAFDRDVFVVGNAAVGFELISMQDRDGDVFDRYDHGTSVRAGAVDLRRERVRTIGHSRLFDPYDFRGYVPVSLLPEGAGWLMDYGPDAISAYDDPYYYYDSEGTADAYRTLPPRTRTTDASFTAEMGAQVSIRRETSLSRIR